MAKYYYDKYQNNQYFLVDCWRGNWSDGVYSKDETWSEFNTNWFGLCNDWLNINGAVATRPFGTNFDFNSTSGFILLNQYTLQIGQVATVGHYFTFGNNLFKVTSNKTAPIKGNLIETVIADDGTYPINGLHTDGYFYVRGNPIITFPEFNMKINGSLKISENGWCKVDGQLREIDKIWTRINGVLKGV